MAHDDARIWREPVRGSYPGSPADRAAGTRAPGGLAAGLWPPPPLSHLTGARPTGFGSGTADAEMPASGWLAASNGVITGGTLAILADIAFGCSIETELPAATAYTTAELSLSFLRPARPGGTLTASGQAIHVGRSVGLSEVFVIEKGSERLLAHGTSRLTIFPPLDPAPEPPTDLEPFEAPEHGMPDPYLRPAPNGVIEQEVWDELPGAEIVRRQLAGELPPPPTPSSDWAATGRDRQRHGHRGHALHRVARQPQRPATGRRNRDARRLRDADRCRDDRPCGAGLRRPRPEGQLPAPRAARRDAS